MLRRIFGSKTILPARRPSSSDNQVLGFYMAPDGRVTPVGTKSSPGLTDLLHWRGSANNVAFDPAYLVQAYVASVWAFRCINVKAQAVGRMPWRIVDAQSRKPIEGHPLEKALKRNPGLLRKWCWALDIWGEAFIEKQLNRYEYPAGLKWLNPLGMDVDTSRGYISSFNYTPVRGGKWVVFSPDEIAFSLLDNPVDDLRGLSPLAVVMEDVGIDKDMTRTIRSFYTNDSRPGMMLVPKNGMVNEADAKRFLEFWKANYQGPQNAGKPVLLLQEYDLKEIQRTPGSQDVELKMSVRRDICAGIGVPLSLAGAWDDSQYQSLPEQRQSFYEETTIPRCEQIGQDMNAQVMPFFDGSARAEFEWVFDDILALSAAGQHKSTMLNTRLASGGITLNEYREQSGLQRLEKGDVLFMPAGIVPTPLNKIGEMPPPTPGGPAPGGAPGFPPGLAADPKAFPVAAHARPRHTPATELRAWERKALQKGARKAYNFECRVLPETWAHRVREGLKTAQNREAVKSLFGELRLAMGECEPLYFSLRLSEESRAQIASFVDGYRQSLPGEGVGWLDPSLYHVTLAYTPLGTPTQTEALKDWMRNNALSWNSPRLRVDTLSVFDTPEGQAVHLRLERTPSLLDLQEQVTGALQSCGLEVSEHHATRDAYKPHITLCYVPPEIAVPGVLFEGGGFDLVASAVQVGGEDYKLLMDVPFVKASLADLPTLPEEMTATPEEYAAYWGEYDRLQAELGDAWLEEYMRRALRELKKLRKEDPGLVDTEAEDVLDELVDGLAEEWVGTEAEPGPLYKLFLAGLASGNEAVIREMPADPLGANKAGGLTLDWELANSRAYHAALSASYDLIQGLNAQTRADLRKEMAAWIQSGAPLSDLDQRLERVFLDPNRARLIAQTESSRVFTNGVLQRWVTLGIWQATFHTVRDQHVCKQCQSLHKQTVNMHTGQTEDGKLATVPVHPGCRCFWRPIVPEEDVAPKLTEEDARNAPLQALAVQRVLERNHKELERFRKRVMGARQKVAEAEYEKRRRIRDEKLDPIQREMWDLEILALGTYELPVGVTMEEFMRDFQGDDRNIARWKQLSREQEKLWAQLDRSTKRQRAVADRQSASLINFGDTYYTRIYTNDQATPEQQAAYEEATKFVGRVLDKERYSQNWIPDAPILFYDPDPNDDKSRQRSYYDRGRIWLTPDRRASTTTVVHEWGHHLEDMDPRVHQRAVEFLENRIQGKPLRRLRDITGNDAYGDGEMAYDGAFKDPYIAKEYLNDRGERYASEVISMGLQYLHADPERFAEEDPEYFNFMVALVRGDL